MPNGDYLPLIPTERPPNFRECEPDGEEKCGNCKHFVDHVCEAYDSFPVLELNVCDSFEMGYTGEE